MPPSSSAVLESGAGAVVRQRTGDDCMACALAMLAGRGYDEVVSAAQLIHPGYAPGDVLPHSLLRRIAHDWGLVLVSSIYMDWRHPGIVGVLSLTLEGCGHALYWDGSRLIDPGGDPRYDRDYVERNAVEFTQRAGDLKGLIALDESLSPSAGAAPLADFF
ncbi:MAG TPA: hypothetical protein VIE16_07725 [Phenylobacterium sp.]|jgi:hypothetical protein